MAKMGEPNKQKVFGVAFLGDPPMVVFLLVSLEKCQKMCPQQKHTPICLTEIQHHGYHGWGLNPVAQSSTPKLFKPNTSEPTFQGLV